MVIGPSGGEFVAAVQKGGGECGGVFDHLLCVGFELCLEAFAEAYGFGGDDVFERAALCAGEHGGVHCLGVFLFAKDEPAARSAQGFVRGSGDEVGDGNGRRMLACGDESGDVREEVGADVVCDVRHPGEVYGARVGAGTDGDHAWFFALGDDGELLVVNAACVLAHAVLGKLVEFSGEIGRVAVREVSAVGEVHSEDFVPGLEHSGVNGEIGLCAGVGLHVGVFGAKKFLGALDGDAFDNIHMFAAAIPAFARVTLGVLIGKHAALGLKDGRVGEIFRRDELDVRLLAFFLGLNGLINFRIKRGESGGGEHRRWYHTWKGENQRPVHKGSPNFKFFHRKKLVVSTCIF